MRPLVYFGDMYSRTENSWGRIVGSRVEHKGLVERIFTASISNER